MVKQFFHGLSAVSFMFSALFGLVCPKKVNCWSKE